MKGSLGATDSDFGSLTPDQIRRLLALATASSAALTDPETVDEANGLLAELLATQDRPAERLFDVACADGTPLTRLRSLKDLAKELTVAAQEPSHREAATLLYHVVVAAAYLRFGVNISSRPLAERESIYQYYAALHSGNDIGQIFGMISAQLEIPGNILP